MKAYQLTDIRDDIANALDEELNLGQEVKMGEGPVEDELRKLLASRSAYRILVAVLSLGAESRIYAFDYD
jgi:hypothetical protein